MYPPEFPTWPWQWARGIALTFGLVPCQALSQSCFTDEQGRDEIRRIQGNIYKLPPCGLYPILSVVPCGSAYSCKPEGRGQEVRRAGVGQSPWDRMVEAPKPGLKATTTAPPATSNFARGLLKDSGTAWAGVLLDNTKSKLLPLSYIKAHLAGRLCVYYLFLF